MQVINNERRMGLTRWGELRLHTQVDLQRTILKPTTTTRGKMGRLRYLGNTKHARIECPGIVLLADWHCKLNVIEPVNGHYLTTITGLQSAVCSSPSPVTAALDLFSDAKLLT